MATRQRSASSAGVLCELILCGSVSEVMIVLLPLTAAGGWREPAGRRSHSTAADGEEVFLWAGEQRGIPSVHDSAGKRVFLSSVEVFNVNTGCWEQRTTRGTPPLGVWGYSCVAVRNDLYYFGGWCGHSGCYHNSVHTLSTSTLQWRMLAPTTSKVGTPMKKSGCGVVYFADEEEDLPHPLINVGHSINKQIWWVMCIPANNTFSACPQVSACCNVLVSVL